MSAVILLEAGCASRTAPHSRTPHVEPVALGATRDPEAAAGRADRLSVLSFNMQHKDRPRDLEVLANRLHSEFAEVPDFVLLQEVVFNRAARKGESNTAEVLANELGYHCRGAKRSSDREGVAIISRYPFEFFDACHHKAQTSRLLLGFNRVSVMGEFTAPDIGRVRVVNVHFTNWGFEEHVRRKQLAETLRWIAHRQSAVPADVIILGGDFNIEPDWDELHVLNDMQVTGGIHYQDFNDPRTDTFGAVGNPSKRVDYIFVAQPTREGALRHVSERALWPSGLISSSSRQRVYLSDHLPLLQEYEVQVAPTVAAAQ